MERNIYKIGKELFITSNEEIKDGEWHLHYYEDNPVISKSHNRAVKVVNEIAKQFGYKKIILTTDADLINEGVQEITDEFLEWFVENPNCEWVVVEKKMLCDYCGEENCDNLRCRGYIDSVWYEIIIPNLEI